MTIRPYQTQDFKKVVNLVELNVPAFFHSSESADFEMYLNNEREEYFVCETENKIVAAGGINYAVGNAQKARLSWDVVHPNFQGKGIGSKLLDARIKRIEQSESISVVEVRTSNLAHHFYAKHKFEKVDFQKDFWAKGIDMVVMHRTLT